eukprot:7529927-Alexandrium_andersonii.AAC.1
MRVARARVCVFVCAKFGAEHTHERSAHEPDTSAGRPFRPCQGARRRPDGAVSTTPARCARVA